jgi:hypothetical protein
MSFTCPRCGATSHHPKDEEHGYCGACHDFTGELTPYQELTALYRALDRSMGHGNSEYVVMDKDGNIIRQCPHCKRDDGTHDDWCRYAQPTNGPTQ